MCVGVRAGERTDHEKRDTYSFMGYQGRSTEAWRNIYKPELVKRLRADDGWQPKEAAPMVVDLKNQILLKRGKISQ
jgi:hypothetical protein